jgi:type VI secretion system VasD/TssJ family lipoprotein
MATLRVRYLALWVPAVLAACGGPAGLYVRGVKPMNENDRQESTPVDIRIFQLRDEARFTNATVDDLWTKAREVLGEDYHALKQVTVFPGAPDTPEVRIELGELPESVRFIGVLALFPKDDGKGPRKLAVARKEAGSRVLRLTGSHLELEP